MNARPSQHTHAKATRKDKAPRLEKGRYMPTPSPDVDPDALFEFASRVDQYAYTKREGLDAFRWVEDVQRRYDETGELPNDPDALLAVLFVWTRHLRFSTMFVNEDWEALMPQFRAILTKIHAMGVDRVAIPE